MYYLPEMGFSSVIFSHLTTEQVRSEIEKLGLTEKHFVSAGTITNGKVNHEQGCENLYNVKGRCDEYIGFALRNLQHTLKLEPITNNATAVNPSDAPSCEAGCAPPTEPAFTEGS
ncbi:MAG: hypothetical protein Q7R81_04060 [Candidatus Peregrinibacteria bacterium]|nr:hypothetical protein [Candidatus Peregrinibacteria bacterium]